LEQQIWHIDIRARDENSNAGYIKVAHFRFMVNKHIAYADAER
jgi:hypothetical protein